MFDPRLGPLLLRASLVACAVLVTAGAVLGLRGTPSAPPPPAGEKPAPAADALPPGAVAAIGTTQFRQVSWHKRVFFAADGNSLVVTDDGNTVRTWDPADGRLRHELPVPGARFGDADFAPAAGLLAVVGTFVPDEPPGKSEHRAWLIDVPRRAVVHTLRLPEVAHSVGHAVRITPDGKRVFTMLDGDLRVWDARTGDELIRQSVRSPGGPGALAVSSDGKTVVFGRHDLAAWEWETGREPKPFATLGGFGTELFAFAPGGTTLYVQPYGGGPLRAWDVAAGRQVGTFDVGYPPAALGFSPDGRTLAVAYREQSRGREPPRAVVLWDVGTGKEVGRLPLGRASVGRPGWSPDGTKIAAGSSYRVFAWDVKTGRQRAPPAAGHEGVIGALAFGPGGTLYTASDDGTIRSWDAATGRPGLELPHDHWVRDLAVSPDGALVAGSALRNDLRVWDAATGKPRFRLLGNGELGGKRVVRFVAGGTRLVAWGDDEFLRVWDVRTGKLLAENRTGPAPDPDDPFADRMFLRGIADAADVSPDGTAFALGSGKTIRLLDPMTGRERRSLDAGPDAVRQVAFSPDGKRLAVARQGKPVETKLPDGRTRRSAGDEYPVSVVDLATGKPVWTATAEGSWPGLAYSPDGSRVAVVSNVFKKASRVWVWDAATGAGVGRIELPRRGTRVAFSADGRHLAVAFDDTTALVYDLAAALAPKK